MTPQRYARLAGFNTSAFTAAQVLGLLMTLAGAVYGPVVFNTVMVPLGFGGLIFIVWLLIAKVRPAPVEKR